ncbi:pyridoxal 5'-phosphate synthase [Gammaproteobacteria bacterium]|nr:pyridoxal 5'-phosphate synthase [Gammaproteobacteria bacterium]
MINFIDLNSSKPYQVFEDLYKNALENQQDNIDAICISSYDNRKSEVNSRYVNLKYIKDNKWVFFTNYDSPKNREFKTHSQISCIFFWHNSNIQIRIKAEIYKLDKESSDKHFCSRSEDKNALAISSNQSKKIISYEQVVKNYKAVLNYGDDLFKRPEYWGGYYFIPYHFEFWTGHKSRINKREVFDKTEGNWKHSFLQP